VKAKAKVLVILDLVVFVVGSLYSRLRFAHK